MATNSKLLVAPESIPNNSLPKLKIFTVSSNPKTKNPNQPLFRFELEPSDVKFKKN